MDNTLLVACVGAAAASIGVTLAKDTKVSEFRQAWIDSLREDVAKFISIATRAFEESHGLVPHKPEDKLEDLASMMMRLNTVMYRIILRLDLKNQEKKPGHGALILALSEVQNLIELKTATRAAFHTATDKIWMTTADLLDTAWKHVKRGESNYRRVLKGSCAILVVCAVANAGQLIYQLWHPDNPVTHVVIDQAVPAPLAPIQPPTIKH